MGDLIFELAEWMRTTALVDWAIAMTEWPLNAWIVENFWAIPILQVIHIIVLSIQTPLKQRLIIPLMIRTMPIKNYCAGPLVKTIGKIFA